MVDEERVTRLLGRIRRDLEELGRAADQDAAQVRADTTVLDAVKYRFITAIEGCARVASHIVVAEGWAAPESNADALAEMGRRGVITGDLAAHLGQASGFRNLLVHQYADVDDDRVVAQLQELADLDAFVIQVAAWLDRPTQG